MFFLSPEVDMSGHQERIVEDVVLLTFYKTVPKTDGENVFNIPQIFDFFKYSSNVRALQI